MTQGADNDNYIPIDEYHNGTPGISASGLIKIAQFSPAHFRTYLEQPPKETKAMLLGSALHCAALEPDTFDQRFAVAPDVDRRTTVGKAAYAAFLEAHPNARIITQEDYTKAIGMAEAVRSHPAVVSFLSETAAIEGTLSWVDAETGVQLKARPDVRLLSGRVLDVKSCTDARPDAFARNIFNFGYHIQAATYMEAVRVVCGLSGKPFTFIAVENEAPYAVAVYELDRASAEIGDMQMRSAIATYAWCEKNNCWPGYPDQISAVSLPVWAARA